MMGITPHSKVIHSTDRIIVMDPKDTKEEEEVVVVMVVGQSVSRQSMERLR